MEFWSSQDAIGNCRAILALPLGGHCYPLTPPKITARARSEAEDGQRDSTPHNNHGSLAAMSATHNLGDKLFVAGDANSRAGRPMHRHTAIDAGGHQVIAQTGMPVG